MTTENYMMIILVMAVFALGTVTLQMFFKWQRESSKDRRTEQEAAREQMAVFQKMQQDTSEKQSAHLAQILHSTLKSQEDLQRKVTKPESHDDIGLNAGRSEEHTSELQSRQYLVCRLLLEKTKN